jgi:hypothetical protein
MHGQRVAAALALTLVVLPASARADPTVTDFTAARIALSRQNFEAKNTRLDLEASLQQRVNDNFGWLIGARYERATIEVDTTFTGSVANAGGSAEYLGATGPTRGEQLTPPSDHAGGAFDPVAFSVLELGQVTLTGGTRG